VRRRSPFENLSERLRSSLWFTPSILVACMVALLALLLRVDSRFDNLPEALRFTGDAEAARDVASTIAGATMGFIGIVFSITIIALQLASNQFSPRVLRGFLRNRLTKVTLGTFVSTLAYSLLLIRHLDASDVTVPDLALDVLFLLTAACIVLFVVFIDHVAHSIRAVNVIETIASETRHAIERDRAPLTQPPLVDPSHDPFGDDGVDVRHRGAGAVLVHVDRERLASIAADGGVVVELLARPGDFVRTQGVVARLHGLAAGGDAADVRVDDALDFDVERTMQDDLAFGLRQLVDVGLRALSPGINDPTTAVQALDRIHDLLAMLLERRDPDPWVRDADGKPRAWTRTITWSELVALGLDELRLAGTSAPQVQRRMRALLDDLLRDADPTRAHALQVRRDALDAALGDSFELELDVELASAADASGIG
jgi:uncharacterized membrane protein